MNPDLLKLNPYPFQKLKRLLDPVECYSDLPAIDLSIGEPKQPPPSHVPAELAQYANEIRGYPTTPGSNELRNSLKKWLEKRYKLSDIDASSQILPVNGSREALFALAQVVINKYEPNPKVVMPNPFYQIYEGAALLAGAQPLFINLIEDKNYKFDLSEISSSDWKNVQLVYVCSPNNPTGRVVRLSEWEEIFYYADKYNFVIASDECYSEIYFDESSPPLGSLEASKKLGRDNFQKLIAFGSLSKRSNVPGLRSGFVAGDGEIISNFLKFRTYHGSAMGPHTQKTSISAWKDEYHVAKNREHYKTNFSRVISELKGVADISHPEAGFYLWLKTPTPSLEFSKELYGKFNVTVLPGAFLARDHKGVNPGNNKVRIALVASPDVCVDAAQRIKKLIRQSN